MIASRLEPLNVLAVPLVLTALAQRLSAQSRATLLCAAQATLLLAIYRLAYISIPLVWYAADSVGRAMGWVAQLCTRRPLWVGATMGGVDYLVPMLYLAIILPLRSRRFSDAPRTFEKVLLAVFGVLVVLLGIMLYMLALAFAGDLLAAIAEDQAPKKPSLSQAPPEPFLSPENAAIWRKLVPWNMPVLAAAIQCAIAWALFYWFRPQSEAASVEDSTRRTKILRRIAGTVGAAYLAAAIPVATVLCPSRPDIADKKIVFYEKGYLNWLKPEHGQYGRLSVGMYGNLPTYLESLGAKALISPDLSDADLKDAVALVIIYPNEKWEDGQLERIADFVRRGGSLMVMGEHTVRETDGGSRINDVLGPTEMRVPFDSAVFAIGGWLHSYDALAHPTSAGVGDEANQFGVVIGGSVQARWPAQPLLVGRWGFADRGEADKGEATLGNERYEAGEKLGDVILAAEQPLGDGKVICFGDPSLLINGLTVSCHEYTSRLFTYLLGGGSTPQTTWRQLTGLAAIALLLALLLGRPRAGRLAAAALSLAASLAACTALTYQAWDVLPDGAFKAPNNLAYIDASHLNADSPESWREDGLGALQLTLMRNGYMPLLLSQITPERLSKARLLFIDAPAREYSEDECRIVRDFARRGGIVIITVGYERAGPSSRLLSTLGFHVGTPEPDAGALAEKPHPLGHFKSPFFNGRYNYAFVNFHAGWPNMRMRIEMARINYLAFVRFHAAWPVYCDDPTAYVAAATEQGKPVIVVRQLRSGVVAVIGDTCFAMMKNLENEDGTPIEGLRENTVFWRWFLASVGGSGPWYPPKPQIEAPADNAAPPAVAPPEAPLQKPE